MVLWYKYRQARASECDALDLSWGVEKRIFRAYLSRQDRRYSSLPLFIACISESQIKQNTQNKQNAPRPDPTSIPYQNIPR